MATGLRPCFPSISAFTLLRPIHARAEIAIIADSHYSDADTYAFREGSLAALRYISAELLISRDCFIYVSLAAFPFP